MEDQLKGKCDYFTQFIKECIKDLKETKTCLVFNKDQADIIMEMYPNAKMEKSELGYVINLPKKKGGVFTCGRIR